jgi:allantoin racemase
MARICFLNPFGTDAYDELVRSTLVPSLHGATEVEIRHLRHAPRNIDFFAGKHLVETEIMKAAIEAETDGFDAFVIGCCYDPALSQCRELVDIPVIGPMEASVLLSRLFGQSFAIVTDHRKAVPELRDMVRIYGVEPNCRSVDAIDWQIESVIADPARCAQATYDRVREVMARTGAETVALGCTIVAASYELAVMNGDARLAEISVINPNAMAVKLAEMFADLRATKQYRISRVGYYQRHEAFDPVEAAEIRALLTDRSPTKAAAATTSGSDPS